MPQHRHPRLRDRIWLITRYYDHQRTIEEIAEELGASGSAVGRAMRDLGIGRRAPVTSRTQRGTLRQGTYIPQLRDQAWLREQYEEQGLSSEAIAAQIGCSKTTVQHALRLYGIPLKVKGGQVGRVRRNRDPFLNDPEWLRQRYLVEGKSPAEIAVETGRSELTVRSQLSRYGIKKFHPRPHGEDVFTTPDRRMKHGSSGYVLIWRPDHPAAKSSGYVPEHRLVVEQELGRYLKDEEIVHHLNLQRDDNRPENLLVFPTASAHHSFHFHPPEWIPRCSCCGKPWPESLTARPEHVPLLYLPQ